MNMSSGNAPLTANYFSVPTARKANQISASYAKVKATVNILGWRRPWRLF
jgi:hypothetical protein